MDGKVFVFLVVVACARAEYANDGFDFSGFLPSYQRTEDQLAEPSARVEKTRDDRDSQPQRTERFGISAYGGSGQGAYGGTAPGLYGPVKIDLGGVLIGSIIGFGAVIILPKIIQALSYSYGGGYGRSLETDFSQVSEWMAKVDDTLSRYNVDTASCMQRLTCTYVQLANENVITGNATDFDAMLSSLSRLKVHVKSPARLALSCERLNMLVRRMLSGTAIYESISAGGTTDSDCQELYPKCKLDKKTVVKVLTQLVPSS